MTDDVEMGVDQAVTMGRELFIVRNGEGEGAEYVICNRIAAVSGSHRIPGESRTVAEIVEAQKLRAARVTADSFDNLATMSFQAQSGQDVSIAFHKK